MKITKSQLREIIREEIQTLNEAKYDTFKKKVNFLKKKGNIVTFKRKIEGRNQTIIDKLETAKHSSYVRIHGQFGYSTSWFDTIDDLIDVVDWKWMEARH